MVRPLRYTTGLPPTVSGPSEPLVIAIPLYQRRMGHGIGYGNTRRWRHVGRFFVIPKGTPGGPFSTEQKEYLDGFFRAQNRKIEVEPSTPASNQENVLHLALGKRAQQAWIAAGKRLSKEEKIKFDANPLDAWPRIAELSAQNALPEGEDLYRLKTHGLWNVSPAQTAMMCRLRIPGGVLNAHQAQAIAKAASAYGGGYVDITTRANFQIREIPAKHMLSLLTDLHECGITPRGSGADNIRNVTGNATCGIDKNEFYNVLPLCRQLHHLILHDRDLFGLPRKFNVAFDGGNTVSSLEDTNDIGLKAVKILDRPGLKSGIYFRVALGGITGHGDLARDTGLLLKPEECLPVITAMIKVYIASGDRGNRKRARLKYVLDSWGFEKFLSETQKLLTFELRRLPESDCLSAPPINKVAHLGIHHQRQTGLNYIGVDVPVGRLTVQQLRGLANLSKHYGSGTLRLTVWQNLILSDIPDADLSHAIQDLHALGLNHEANPISAGIVACTGAEGCKFGMAPTKSTALAITDWLKDRITLEHPVNIHLTGCTHSCAQHFIGDIGLLATGVDTENYKGPGFHFFVGGGYGRTGRMAVAAVRFVPVPQVPMEIERILNIYLELRMPQESFSDFTGRQDSQALQALFLDAALTTKEQL